MKVLIIIIALTIVLGFRFYTYLQSIPHYQEGQLFSITTALQEEPEASNLGQSFSIKDSYNQVIHISTNAFPKFNNGQVLQISGRMQAKVVPGGRIIYSLYYPRVQILANDQNIIFMYARRIREQTKFVYDQSLPPASSSLLMGIVFGSKEHFSADFLSDLQATGVMHVIAASGMNVTFVAAALMYILIALFRRQIALVFAISGILFYVFLVGFQASILRAAIMAVLSFGANLLGRLNYAGFAVLLTAYCMLLWQPGYISDVGFQLSFLATVGIMYLKQVIPIKETIYTESFITTLAAQMSTLPILIGVFGKVGMFSLVVNAITLWTIPILMTLGSLAAVFSFIAFPVAKLLLLLCLPFLLYFENTVSFFGRIGGVVHVVSFPWPFTVAYYLLLTAFTLSRKSKTVPPAHEY